jgi:hypothetical protein
MNAAKLDRRFERFKQKDGSHIESLLTTALEIGREQERGTFQDNPRTRKGKSWNLR